MSVDKYGKVGQNRLAYSLKGTVVNPTRHSWNSESLGIMLTFPLNTLVSILMGQWLLSKYCHQKHLVDTR